MLRFGLHSPVQVTECLLATLSLSETSSDRKSRTEHEDHDHLAVGTCPWISFTATNRHSSRPSKALLSQLENVRGYIFLILTYKICSSRVLHLCLNIWFLIIYTLAVINVFLNLLGILRCSLSTSVPNNNSPRPDADVSLLTTQAWYLLLGWVIVHTVYNTWDLGTGIARLQLLPRQLPARHRVFSGGWSICVLTSYAIEAKLLILAHRDVVWGRAPVGTMCACAEGFNDWLIVINEWLL